MQTSEDQARKRLALAHRMAELTSSALWREIAVPYFEEEQKVNIENMASLTDPMQLMRYAGAVQTFHALIHLEQQVRSVIESTTEKKLSKFKN